MSRPAVSVVVPFAGSAADARAVIAMLRSLRTQPGDELIISDNSGTAPVGRVPQPRVVELDPQPGKVVERDPQDPWETGGAPPEITVVKATKESSASHARNVGARAAHNDWLLFLDSDVQPPADLLERFFGAAIGERAGAVTGDIAGIPDTSTLASRYGTARNFLGQRSHVNNPYRPRASSANLLVRRAAFDAVNGYTEGIWAAEDTDFTWRLQDHGWTLEFNQGAVVRHEYRRSLRALGRQWRGYAAGARWLSERYPDFKPDPGFNRGVRILLRRLGIGPGVAFRADGRGSETSARLTRAQRLQFLLVQCYLGVEEQIGLRQSNTVKRRSGAGEPG